MLVIMSTEWADAPASGPMLPYQMLPYQWMSDVYPSVTLQALRRLASGVECKCLGAAAQKSDTAPVPDAYKQIQIQIERFDAGKRPVATPVCVAELDFVRRAGDELA